MTPYISANYSMPAAINSAKSAAAASTNTGTSTNSTEASDIGTTFLSLLTQELKNQDPTAPMDSTAMVGQMISLNQLAQLTSINQAVGGSTTSVTGASQPAAPTPAASTPAVATPTRPLANNATTSSLPFNINTMMPVSYPPITLKNQQN